MKCKKCKKRNRSDANYCMKCGYKFTKEEKEDAKEIYIPAILKKTYDYITLKVITENPVFRVLYVLVVLCIGIYMLISMGSSLRILESDLYEVNYNEKNNTFYVFVSNDKDINKISTLMYVPNKIDSIDLSYYKEDGTLLSQEKDIDREKVNLLVNNNSNNYYTITGNNKDEIKVYVYYSEVKDENEKGKK